MDPPGPEHSAELERTRCRHCEVLVGPGDVCPHTEQCMLGDLRDCLALALIDGRDDGGS